MHFIATEITRLEPKHQKTKREEPRQTKNYSPPPELGRVLQLQKHCLLL